MFSLLACAGFNNYYLPTYSAWVDGGRTDDVDIVFRQYACHLAGSALHLSSEKPCQQRNTTDVMWLQGCSEARTERFEDMGILRRCRSMECHTAAPWNPQQYHSEPGYMLNSSPPAWIPGYVASPPCICLGPHAWEHQDNY